MFTLLQYVLPQHSLSRLVGAVCRVRVPWFKNLAIRWFVRGYRPQMQDALQPDPQSFGSFNEFFTRALRPDARPLADSTRKILCPVDGTVSELGSIEQDRVLQAKGHHYTVGDLLAGNALWAARFAGGEFATIYLAPYNYHRIHMPTDGRLLEAWYVPGRLFSVNRATVDSVARLFARNERVVCLFEQQQTPFAVILVGALNVGSMDTVWHGNVAPRRPGTVQRLPDTSLLAPPSTRAGDELGRFNMGSTVVLLFPRGTCHWRADLKPGSTVRMGEALAERLS